VGLLLHLLIGLLPVLGFLLVLLWLDSYKLVTMRVVVTVVALGVVVAGACYVVNGLLFKLSGIGFTNFSRYVGPVTEELGKGLVVVALIRMNRVGFLVDAAILGFAVGTGFALVENVYYQRLIPDAGIGTWIVRGFGTAIMHGAATAMFAIIGLAMTERSPKSGVAAFLPGFALAVATHAAFNTMPVSPLVSTLAVMIALPPLLLLVFQRSERAVAKWLGHGFDADTQMLESITSGNFPDSPGGQYLASLKHRFKGAIVADLLCYLRLHTELALRAKGILMMRENGFDATLDETTRAKFDEMRYLEQSIGKTGRLALLPLLHGGNKDIWQLKMLEGEAQATAGPAASTSGGARAG
jgi:protease PrsW